MELSQILYYIVANLIVIAPGLYLASKKGVIFIPLLFYIFFIWLFLVAGIPLANDVSVLGGYSFSYNIKYIGVLFSLVFPVIIFCMIAKGREKKIHYITSLNEKGSLGFFFCLWFVSVCGVFTYTLLFGPPPLLDSLSLSGRSSEIYSLRMSVTYGENYRRYDVFFILIPGIATLLGAYLYKRKVLPMWGFGVSFVLYCLLSFSFLHKSHIVVFVISIFLVFYFFSNKTMVKVFLAPFFVSLGLLLASYIFYIGFDSYNLSDLLIMIFQRVLVPYIVSLDFVLNNFGSEISFLMGASLPNPRGIFDIETIYLSNLLMNLIAGKAEGTIPAPSVGFLYANFGFFGVFINAIIVFGYFLLLYLVSKKCRYPIGFVVWIYLSVSSFNFSVRDPFGVIDGWVFIILIVFLFWKMVIDGEKKDSEYCIK
ncbi:O-antigen polymerase [Marinobacter nauticus]